MQKFTIGFLFFFLVLFAFCSTNTLNNQNSLNGKTICIDPGHRGTAEFDSFRVGPSGEREEWIDLRVALLLRDMLEVKGAKVIISRTKDINVPLKKRALMAVENKVDVFLSIHHNATADSSVNFPIIYFHGNASENKPSVILGKILAEKITESLYSSNMPVSLVSDHTIFPNSGTAVLRHSYGIPGVIGEASFFSNPSEEKRLKVIDYNRKEAEAYLAALEEYFSVNKPVILEKYSNGKVEPFQVFQEAERMNEVAKKWREDFDEGKRLFMFDDPDSLQKAFIFFTRSAKSFPDCYLARECHIYRANLLQKLGNSDEMIERKRVTEFYPNIN